MKVGDLVRVLHHDSAGHQRYNGRTGLLTNIVERRPDPWPNSTYYNVLLSGETSVLKFRKHSLEVVSASR